MQANDPQIPIPNLDQLISEGVSLRSYYTLPVCSPTRTSILSGRYPMHVGTQHQVLWAGQRAGLPLKDKTIADRLSARGYTCHAIGKWHTGFYSWEHTPIGTTPHTRTPVHESIVPVMIIHPSYCSRNTSKPTTTSKLTQNIKLKTNKKNNQKDTTTRPQQENKSTDLVQVKVTNG